VPSEASNASLPANDAMLVQLVRGALGRRWRGTSGINVSSCYFVVTLNGTVGSVEEGKSVETAVLTVPGVEDVVNRLRVT
jgi:osmotically-inducible protein OsmY